ncbi:ABC transporter substrate-binding protein [Micromonospora sp. MA102]|uniref:ABC transporter substrate-binding protein n=1 Tax=Micromonospora sp. MA102 TaxID=2952755 RepID=UPI0021CA216F|nr:ABC transporter substrate-binding protein [Micromonospora sp. MA102]
MKLRFRRVSAAVFAVTAMTAMAACQGRSSSTDAGDVTNTTGVGVEQVVTKDQCQSYDPSPGISSGEIKLGSSYPDSGPLASIGEANKGMEAYFKHLNETGGINGRKVTLIGKDDQYDPTKATANVNELLQSDRVFAIVGVQSTTGTMAVWDQLQKQCVPILESTISSASMAQRAAHPNATDGLVPYPSEAYALGTYVTKQRKNTKVALIAQAGTFGTSAKRGLEKSLADNGAQLVASATFQVTDPTVTSQITTLKASGADALVVVAAGTKCPQIFDAVGDADWHPTLATTFTCANTTLMKLAKPANVNGVISDSWVRLRTQGDPESDAYFAALAKYFPQVNAGSENVAIGWAQGEVVAETLKRATALTRVDVINSALGLKDVKIGMAADGVLVNTSKNDTAPVESVQITQFDSGALAWKLADGSTGPIDVGGKLAELAG